MKKKETSNFSARLENILQKGGGALPARGELWMSTAFLQKAGFDDTIESHFSIASQLGQDMVCLPICEKKHHDATLGYRYFEPADLRSDYKDRTKFFAVMIDGPFQRMVNKRGLMEVLMHWGQDREALIQQYCDEQEKSLFLVEQCLEKGVDAVILADDLSGEQTPLINPLEIERVCTPFYSRAFSMIRQGRGLLFLHCCGNLQPLLHVFNSWGIDGLAAIQTEKNDMDFLDEAFNGVLLTGIEANLLEKEALSADEIEDLRRFVACFSAQNRLILCSSCGLYSANFWGRLQHIYALLGKSE